MHGIRLLCGASILWAFIGYIAELLTLYQVQALPGFDACAGEQTWSVLLTIDKYAPLTILLTPVAILLKPASDVSRGGFFWGE